MIDPGNFERYRPLIDDWDGFLAALERPLPTSVWANTLRISARDLQERLGSRWPEDPGAVEPRPWCLEALRIGRPWRPGQSFEYLTGLCHVQEEVSLVPCLLLDPGAGERILDLCAAPGGKTARLAVAMENRGTLVANDLSYQRLRAMRGNLDRLGVANASLTTYDGANFPPDSGLFDRVLADVPCSCEGTSRKSPEVFARSGPEASRRMARVQRAILRKAVQLCEPGGRVVYSTCTYAPEENEEVVDAILDEVGAAALEVLPAALPGLAGKPGLTSWQGRSLAPDLAHCLRIWPQLNDTGGFFVAVLEKSRGGKGEGS